MLRAALFILPVTFPPVLASHLLPGLVFFPFVLFFFLSYFFWGMGFSFENGEWMNRTTVSLFSTCTR
jgi:hypothetical protein